MGLRLPKADLYFNQYTDAQLLARAQQIHDGLNSTDGQALFSSPPVIPADLAAGIVNYRTKLAFALKGSKAQTQDKILAKQGLINALRADGEYVNQIVTAQFGTGSPVLIEETRNIIYISGYRVSTDPSPAATSTQGIVMPIVGLAISKAPGQVYILLRQVINGKRIIIDRKKGRKLWLVKYRTSAIEAEVPVSAGPWLTQTFTSSRITLIGLTSGLSYDYQVAAIGGRNTKLDYNNPVNFTPITSLIVI